jgi:hypothetical protein
MQDFLVIDRKAFIAFAVLDAVFWFGVGSYFF